MGEIELMYSVSTYGNTTGAGRVATCVLYRVVNKRKAINPMYGSAIIYEYDIEAIISDPHPDFYYFEDDNGYIRWARGKNNTKGWPALYSSENPMEVEFEDDETALCWFKLNY